MRTGATMYEVVVKTFAGSIYMTCRERLGECNVLVSRLMEGDAPVDVYPDEMRVRSGRFQQETRTQVAPADVASVEIRRMDAGDPFCDAQTGEDA